MPKLRRTERALGFLVLLSRVVFGVFSPVVEADGNLSGGCASSRSVVARELLDVLGSLLGSRGPCAENAGGTSVQFHSDLAAVLLRPDIDAPEAAVLELGCGMGSTTALLAALAAHVVVIEKSGSSLDACARRVEDLRRERGGQAVATAVFLEADLHSSPVWALLRRTVPAIRLVIIDAAHTVDKVVLDALQSLRIESVSHLLFHDVDDADVRAAVSLLAVAGHLRCDEELGVREHHGCGRGPEPEALLCRRGPSGFEDRGRSVLQDLVAAGEARSMGWLLWHGEGHLLGLGGALLFVSTGDGSAWPVNDPYYQLMAHSSDGELLGLLLSDDYLTARVYRVSDGVIWGFAVYTEILRDLVERNFVEYRNRYSYDVSADECVGKTCWADDGRSL